MMSSSPRPISVVVLIQEGRLLSYAGRPEQQEEPAELLTGSSAMLYTPRPNDVVITKADLGRCTDSGRASAVVRGTPRAAGGARRAAHRFQCNAVYSEAK